MLEAPFELVGLGVEKRSLWMYGIA